MNVLFLGTGPTKIVKGKGKNRRTNTSALVSFEDTHILINVTKFFPEQIEKAGIEPDDLDAVTISHGHADCTDGTHDFREWLENNDYEYKDNPIPVYCEPETQERLKEDFKEVSHFEFNDINPGDSFSISSVNIVPFRVDHSRSPGKYPAVGFRFENKLTWAEDVADVPKNSEKYFNDVDVVCIDAAMWFGTQIFNHFTIDDTLKFMKDKNVDKIYLVQAGRTYPDYKKASKKIKKFWKDIDGKGDVKLAYDGLKLSELTCKNESELPGIYLVEPHGKMIFSGEKTLIVKSRNFKNMVNKPLYVVQDDKSYGVIKITDIKPINLKKFRKLRSKHQIKESERKEWWKGKRKLYKYDFEIMKKFDKPVKVKVPQGTQTFLKNVKFVTENVVENIRDIETYDPSELTNAQLADDMRIWFAYYASKRRGKSIHIDDRSLSLEDIVNMAKLVYDEIEKRKKAGKMKHEWHPENYKKYSKELFKKISTGKLLKTSQILSDYIKTTKKPAIIRKLSQKQLHEVIPNILNDMTIIDTAVCLVGSVVEKGTGNDIDLLLRMDTGNEFLRRGIAIRIQKELEKHGIDIPVHVFTEKEGPHDNFIPLYDLVLKKRNNTQIVQMSEIKPSKTFKPVKTTAETYYDLDKLAKKLFGD